MKKEKAIEKFENMDSEDRKYEARQRVYKMVIMRVLISILLIWVIFRFDLPVAAVIFLIAVIVMVLGTLIPVFAALKSTLKYEDE